MSNPLDQAMRLIQSLDSAAHIDYSVWTGGWYVSARVNIGGNGFLRGITEHRGTPEDAVFAYLARLQDVNYDTLDSYLVTESASKHRRRHWRWNGAAFVEQPVEAVQA